MMGLHDQHTRGGGEIRRSSSEEWGGGQELAGLPREVFRVVFVHQGVGSVHGWWSRAVSELREETRSFPFLS